MSEFRIGGKIEDIKLNNHIVSVIKPKNIVSYEEGIENVNKIIKKIKSK